MSRLRARAVAALLVAAGGCATGGFDLTDLPDAPLAIIYRTRDESERRVELLQRRNEPALKTEDTDYGEANVLNVDAALDVLGLGRSKEEKAADLLGRMASIGPRSDAVTPYDFAFRGDRPLDWTPDRKRLLFASLRSDSVQLYEWNGESGEVRPMSTGPLEHATGCYLTEGRLAMAGQASAGRSKKRTSRVYVTAPGGAQPRPLSPGPTDGKPACSPDGRLVVYQTVDRSGASFLGVVPSDGSAAPRILGPGADPTFSPDGAFVVYSARTRVGWRLYEMHPDGQGKRPLGAGARDERSPRVSPDGRFVAYVYDDEGRQQLRVRTMDGKKDRPLLWNGDGVNPVW